MASERPNFAGTCPEGHTYTPSNIGCPTCRNKRKRAFYRRDRAKMEGERFADWDQLASLATWAYEVATRSPEGEVEKTLGQFILTYRVAEAELGCLREVEDAHEKGYWVGYGEGKEEAETRDLNYDEATSRAEAAEAEVAELRARLEGLASDWATRENRTGAPYATAFVNGFHAAADDLRAALGGERVHESAWVADGRHDDETGDE